MKLQKKHWLTIILLTAAFLRLWNLGSGDVLGDEGLMAFRSIGMLDFDNAEQQTTPLEWLDSSGPIPSWTKLSFHDHPPLVFLIQNFFMKIFGETPFGFRLPSALFGIASVYLIYLIGRRMFDERVGLFAAGFLAITSNHIFISRVGLQESYVIFFILLAVEFFLRAIQSDGEKNFLLVGGAIGLGLLAKYTAFITVPILLTHIFIYERQFLKNKYLWLGALLAALIFSPVIIYNIALYKEVGHFDFQLSYIFGQQPPEWPVAPGKEEIGTIGDRAFNFLPQIFTTNSWVILALFLASLAFIRNSKLLMISLFYLAGLLFFIGPTTRFITMLAPFMMLSIAELREVIYERFYKGNFMEIVSPAIFIFAVVFEVFYGINTQILHYPVGISPWLYSQKTSAVTYAWGYNELDEYLQNKLAGKYPAIVLENRYQFIAKTQDESIASAKSRRQQSYAAAIVYDDNIFNISQLWVLDRLQVYHGWPVLKVEEYQKFLREQGSSFFKKAGFQKIYFVIQAEGMPTKKTVKDTALKLEQGLAISGFRAEVIKNKRGDAAFRIYELSL